MSKIPNPNGRKGGERHQKKVEEVAQNLKKRGFKTVYEYFIRTLFGRKNRYADIVAIDKETGEIKEISPNWQTKRKRHTILSRT